MKKILVFSIILCMALTMFVGCTGDESNETSQVGNNDVNDNNNNSENNEDTTNEFNALVDQVEVNDDSVTFIDAMDKEVTIEKNPQKVICLYNSYLDLWYDAGGEVIGRIESRSKVPEGAMDAEVVGSMTAPNMEKIISMEPDLLILRPGMQGHSEIIPILEENEIPYLAIEYDNFNQYLYVTKIFTEINGRDDLYEKNGAEISNKVKELVDKAPKDEEPTVLLMFASTRSVTVKLPNTFVGDMLQDLGAKNIAYDAQLTDEEMEVFSMEKVIERDPNFILVQTMGDVEEIKEKLIEDVESNPAWSSLTAVKEGRYIFLPKDLYLYKPNAQYAEAYQGLAEILYPDTFK
ncbi:MAG: ABC transporter substrate-binding protein [Firmicutes bacterium]|nr:ABC transporter substrate-binding protein [Bacillota bacterium]